MSLTTYTLTVRCYGLDGQIFPGALVRAEMILKGVPNSKGLGDYQSGGTILNKVQETTADAQGVATLELVPNTAGTQDSRYVIQIRDPDTQRQLDRATIQMPEADSTLAQLVEEQPVTTETQTAAALSAAQAAESAENAQSLLDGLSGTGETLAPGSEVTVDYDPAIPQFAFGIPQGESGLVASDTEPSDTDVLWLDTSEFGDDLRTPLWYVFRTPSDFLPYLNASDEYELPGGLCVVSGNIDIGDKAIRLSTGTLLRGLGGDRITSSATGGVIRGSGLDAAVVLREFSVIATAGPCLDMSGTTEHQLNCFFLGLFGAKAAIVDGFDVSSFKACFVDAADGITFTGETNKLFVHETPFYSITGAAITLDESLDASVADIVTSFFKFDAPGVGIRAETGYTVGRGLIRGTLVDGTAEVLDGLSPADPNWFMRDNSGIRNSSVIGAFVQSTSAAQETTITAVDTPTLANIDTIESDFNERFDHSNGRLTYTGLDDVTVTALATANISSVSNNQTVRMWVALNGTPLTTAVGRAELSGGGDIDPIAASGVMRISNGDFIEIYVENLSSDGNITLTDASMVVSQSG